MLLQKLPIRGQRIAQSKFPKAKIMRLTGCLLRVEILQRGIETAAMRRVRHYPRWRTRMAWQMAANVLEHEAASIATTRKTRNIENPFWYWKWVLYDHW